MMSKCSSIAKILGRNFSSDAKSAAVLKKSSLWKRTETAQNWACGSLGLFAGFKLASWTCFSNAEYVLTFKKMHEKRLERVKARIKEREKELKATTTKRVGGDGSASPTASTIRSTSSVRSLQRYKTTTETSETDNEALTPPKYPPIIIELVLKVEPNKVESRDQDW